MTVWIGEDGLDNNSVAFWKQFFGPDAQSFVGNRDDFPVDVLFSILVATAPVDVALSFSLPRPVRRLAFFRAVGSLLTSAA